MSLEMGPVSGAGGVSRTPNESVRAASSAQEARVSRSLTAPTSSLPSTVSVSIETHPQIVAATKTVAALSLENCYANVQIDAGGPSYMVLKAGKGPVVVKTTEDGLKTITKDWGNWVLVHLPSSSEGLKIQPPYPHANVRLGLAAGAACVAILGVSVPALAILAFPTALALGLGAYAAGRKETTAASRDSKPASEKATRSLFHSIAKAVKRAHPR